MTIKTCSKGPHLKRGASSFFSWGGGADGILCFAEALESRLTGRVVGQYAILQDVSTSNGLRERDSFA